MSVTEQNYEPNSSATSLVEKAENTTLETVGDVKEYAEEISYEVDTSGKLAEHEAEKVAAPLRTWIDENVENEYVASAAQNSVTTLVTVGATLLIGVIVYARIQEATPAPNDEQLNNSSSQVTDTMASAFDLGSVLPIVIIASAILFFLGGFGGGGGR